MIKKQIIAALLLTLAGSARHQALAQGAPPAGLKRIDLMRQDISVLGREVIQVVIEFAPGATAPRHGHPGEELVYVLEGSLEYALEGKPPTILKAGEVLLVPQGVVHGVKNVGDSNARELATYIVEKGKPLLSFAE